MGKFKELPKLQLIVYFGIIGGPRLFLRKVVAISEFIALDGVSNDLLGSGFLYLLDHLRFHGMKGVETLIASRYSGLESMSFIEPAFCWHLPLFGW